jgi:hypothetical protein
MRRIMLTGECSPYNNQMQKAGSQDKLLWPQPAPASDLERWMGLAEVVDDG